MIISIFVHSAFQWCGVKACRAGTTGAWFTGGKRPRLSRPKRASSHLHSYFRINPKAPAHL
jgi:hypothetical protein